MVNENSMLVAVEDWIELSLFANIEASVTKLQKALFTKKLKGISSSGSKFGLAKEISLALAAAQDVFNYFPHSTFTAGTSGYEIRLLLNLFNSICNSYCKTGKPHWR